MKNDNYNTNKLKHTHYNQQGVNKFVINPNFDSCFKVYSIYGK